MIIPSIDIMNGSAVQLIGGREQALDAGDPRPIAERFALAGEIAVIDLDAALGRGSNAELIRELLAIAPCRVGGGIRDVQTAVKWLDAGASKIILGTAATPEILRQLPAERTIAALDAEHDNIVVEGWRRATGEPIRERLKRLEGLVGGFLITFVEREGRMGGTNLERVPQLVADAGGSAGARITIAGGITTADDIAQLDTLGADAQVGMAIYTGRLDLADAIAAPLTSDRPDGLWPTIVVDEHGAALGLAWSSPESLRQAVHTRRGVYHSRSRGLWTKGETSGNTQDLLRIDLDCDRDALRFTVRQRGAGFCHNDTDTCWGNLNGLAALERRLAQRAAVAKPGSYTARLLADPDLLRAKLIEEAGELADAGSPAEVTHEAADLLYFLMVAMQRRNIPLREVARALDQRALRLTTRPGDAKPRTGATS
jgi:phosphoribosyl-AMP cyclohydrolase / phosphoribosyl-ATP pyrophosphohydrolase